MRLKRPLGDADFRLFMTAQALWAPTAMGAVRAVIGERRRICWSGTATIPAGGCPLAALNGSELLQDALRELGSWPARRSRPAALAFSCHGG